MRTHRHREGGHVEAKAETGAVLLQNKDYLKLKKLGEAGRIFPES